MSSLQGRTGKLKRRGGFSDGEPVHDPALFSAPAGNTGSYFYVIRPIETNTYPQAGLQETKNTNMKKGILILLLLSSVFVNAQSLKEALFSGKLKNQPGTVIRKGDDLSAKMDTVRKAPAEDTATAKVFTPVSDTVAKNLAGQPDSSALAAAGPEKKDTAASASDSASAVAAPEAPKTAAAVTKDNNAIWKTFMDSLNTTLKTEVLSSKKIKSGSYYVLVSYAIGADGQVTIGDVFLSPENAFLQQQIKDRLAIDTPRLNPVPSSSGAPRKVSKKYNFTLTKE